MATPTNTLVITQRPVLELTAESPLYDQPYYESNWNSAHLPIIYKLSNDRFPSNSVDMLETFLTVSNNNGFAQINLQAGYQTYIAKNYVEVLGTVYSGIFRIVSAEGGKITIDTAYQGTDTGTLQTYYKNYYVGIKVYAGRPDYHPLNADDPMTLITDNPIKIVPDSDNIATVDLAGLIRNKLSMDFDADSVDLPNDIDAWTSFYIEFFESFGESEDGLSFNTVQSDIDIDSLSGCNESGELITNGDFSSGLTGWSQGGSGQSFSASGGGANINVLSAAPFNSRVLRQDITDPVFTNVGYNVSVDVDNSTGATIGYKIIVNYGLSDETVIYNQPVSTTVTQDASFTYFPTSEIQNIGIRIRHGKNNEDVDITVDNFSLQVSDCKPYIFAHNGIKQFQDLLGGNFGDYVATANTQLVEAKWMNGFNTPVLFDDYYFDLSTIIPESAWSTVEDREIYIRIQEYDENDTLLLETDVLLDDVSDGVYRIRLDNFTPEVDTCYYNVRLIGFPSNSFEDGLNGTFDSTSAGNPNPSDWNITRFIYSPVTPDQAGSAFNHSTSQGAFTPFEGSGMMYLLASQGSTPQGTIKLLNFDSNIAVIPNADYEISCYIGFQTQVGAYTNLEAYLTPVGYSRSELTINTFNINSVTINDGVWRKISTVFNTGSNTTLQFRLNLFNYNSLGGVGASNIVVDSMTLKGPIFNLTEQKQVNLYKDCIDPAYEPLYLRWLSPLGAWESWLFTARKSHIIDVDDKIKIRRNVLTDFPINFINGETEDDYIRVQAFNKLTVRSQYITEAELEGIKSILYAIRAQHLRADGTKITVLVDSGSFTYKQDRQKLYTISFDIIYTDPIRVQAQ